MGQLIDLLVLVEVLLHTLVFVHVLLLVVPDPGVVDPVLVGRRHQVVVVLGVQTAAAGATVVVTARVGIRTHAGWRRCGVIVGGVRGKFLV